MYVCLTQNKFVVVVVLAANTLPLKVFAEMYICEKTLT